MIFQNKTLAAFRRAAAEVPAYQKILRHHNVDPAQIRSLDDFSRSVPILDKKSTFGSFPVKELCRHGNIIHPAGVLTSSGHSGQFAFGIYSAKSANSETAQLDRAMNYFIQTKTKPTLLINCLPMGVQVPTRLCTVGQVSVRPDMAIALIRQFASSYEQIALIGETAFIKLVLELGIKSGIDWKSLRVHIFLGEEPLAENARLYFEFLLGIDENAPDKSLILSSMGVAELGLNLFFEMPHLAAIRRILHRDPALRKEVLGFESPAVPSLFTYNPKRIRVELLENKFLVISTLDKHRPLPLIRYRTGDEAAVLDPKRLKPLLAQVKTGYWLSRFPVLAVKGRGEGAVADNVPIYPEQIKEGLYRDHSLVPKITANFRLASGAPAALLRIQLEQDVAPHPDLNQRFAAALAPYVSAPLDIRCEPYETFRSGMGLDYERKFAYLDTPG